MGGNSILLASIVLSLSLLVNLPLAQLAPGPTSAVVGNGSPSSCTEAALNQAVTHTGDATFTVTFNCGPNPIPILLTHQVTLTNVTILDGGGMITLDGQGLDRIIFTTSGSNIFLRNLTLTRGVAHATGANDGSGQGGAILVGIWGDINIDHVTFLNNVAEGDYACMGGGAIWFQGFNYSVITNSTFTGNKAANGGAINNLTANLIIRDSVFTGNRAWHDAFINQPGFDNCGGGGAIYIDGADNSGFIQITGSTFRNNSTNNYGGAIVAFLYSQDNMVIDRSIFDGNSATIFPNGNDPKGGCGGAIWFGGEFLNSSRAFTGKYTFTNSTVMNNHADYIGGGIWVWNAPVEMTNLTIASNTASNNLGLPYLYMKGIGGGLAIGSGSSYQGAGTKLTNLTIAQNSAAFSGGAITSLGNLSSLQSQMMNTIIANNTVTDPNRTRQFCNTSLVDSGGNYQYPAGEMNCTQSITIADPLLNNLANNGGPTINGEAMQTMTLKAGSPAIDHAVQLSWLPFDQRGYVRSGPMDSGAVEYNGKPFVPTAWAFLPFIHK